jgi:hypothetical protein
MKKLLLIFLVLSGLQSCKHGADADKVMVSQMRFPPPVVKPDEETMEKEPSRDVALKIVDPGPKSNAGYSGSANPGIVKDTAKKIIKQGDISFETGNIAQTRKIIIASLKKAGGYLSEENESNNSEENRKEYVLKTRIPAKYFDTFLSDVASAATQIDSKNISSRDVTTLFIDMSTRLQNKKLLEARYLSLLKQANRMGDILQVENKLSEIRSEIESEQGQLNYLSKQVTYSSLDITFYTRHIAPVDKGYGAGYKFKRALSEGWDTLTGWFFGLISLWPVLIVIGLLIVLFKRWRKRRKAVQA